MTAVGLTVEDRKIPVTTPPGEVEIRVYTPHSDNSSEVFPLYVNFHGKNSLRHTTH